MTEVARELEASGPIPRRATQFNTFLHPLLILPNLHQFFTSYLQDTSLFSLYTYPKSKSSAAAWYGSTPIKYFGESFQILSSQPVRMRRKSVRNCDGIYDSI
jgi:hypothetical protein